MVLSVLDTQIKTEGCKMAETKTIITKISASNKVSTIDNKRINMYTVVQGKGSKRTSQTRHMTEPQADALRKSLGAE